MKDFIHENNNLRTKAKNDFETNFFKLINNSVFGRQWRVLESIEILNL